MNEDQPRVPAGSPEGGQFSAEQTAFVQKLETKYNPSELLSKARAGDFAGAADHAGKSGMWGLWGEARTAAGLPADDSARQQLLDQVAAAAEAEARSGESYSKEMAQLGKEHASALQVVQNYDAVRIKWETARSLLSMMKEQVRQL